MARRLEEREDQLDWIIEAAIHVTPPLWPFLDEFGIRRVVDDVALRFWQHRERTPDDQRISLAGYVERYIQRVKAEAEPGLAPAEVWTELVNRLDPPVCVAAPLASGVSRRLHCYDWCCLDNPHAEMVLVVHDE